MTNRILGCLDRASCRRGVFRQIWAHLPEEGWARQSPTSEPSANPLPGRRALTEAAKFSYQELWRSYGKQAIFAEPGFNLG